MGPFGIWGPSHKTHARYCCGERLSGNQQRFPGVIPGVYVVSVNSQPLLLDASLDPGPTSRLGRTEQYNQP